MVSGYVAYGIGCGCGEAIDESDAYYDADDGDCDVYGRAESESEWYECG